MHRGTCFTYLNYFINLSRQVLINGFIYFIIKNIEVEIIKCWTAKVLTQVFPQCFYHLDLLLENWGRGRSVFF